MSSRTIKIAKVVVLLVIFIGILLLAYPFIANRYNQLHTSHVVARYDDAVNGMLEEEKENMVQEAVNFNEKLASLGGFELTDSLREEYYKLLDISGTGVMGTIHVPAIGVSMPIYHGNSDAVLQIAAGHMEGSSLPVGGEGTHAVIAAHTGMASAELFTKLKDVKVDDYFVIKVLDRLLTYQVIDINEVLPEEIEYLKIDNGKDYVTLMTCTPPGVNSHRLLVKGERVYLDEGDSSDILNSMPNQIPIEVFILLGLIVFIVILIRTLKNK